MLSGLAGIETHYASVISRKLAEQLDDKIREAISNHLGSTDWALDQIIHRLRRVTPPDSDLEFLTMDDQPILAVGPVQTAPNQAGDANIFTATRGFKILNERAEVAAQTSSA